MKCTMHISQWKTCTAFAFSNVSSKIVLLGKNALAQLCMLFHTRDDFASSTFLWVIALGEEDFWCGRDNAEE